ncbi:hypothetical protein [Gaetbulibacter jejuensis]|uniref:Glycosyl hydrolase family 2 n=1 Tax=Gaetbulibacter jejuensis TaxID=584607 RepID=A0ABN1JGR1_9FLAO
MNKLKIFRKKELNNKNRSFKVFFNDQYIGKLEDGVEYKDFEVDSFHGKLKISVDWCSSNTQKVEFKKGQDNVKVFETSSSIPNYAFLIIIFGCILSTVLYFIFKQSIFAITPLVLILYPLWMITFGRKRYLRLTLR